MLMDHYPDRCAFRASWGLGERGHSQPRRTYRYRGPMDANPATMPIPHHRQRRAPNAREPQNGVAARDVLFRDTTTGKTGVMRQRSSDKIFEFYPDHGLPQPVTEPGRYRRAQL